MERLTNRNYGEISHTGRIIPYSKHCIGCIAKDCDCGIVEDMVKKLANYEGLEEQDRLIKLPFMVGDRVYQISENFIEPCTVEVIFLANYTDKDGNYCNMAEIHYDRDDCPYVSTEIYFTDIGKTLFLTKSEAEAKLKELRGGKNEERS